MTFDEWRELKRNDGRAWIPLREAYEVGAASQRERAATYREEREAARDACEAEAKKHAAALERAEKAEARVKELEARVADMDAALDDAAGQLALAGFSPGAELRLARTLADDYKERAERAESERDAALAQVAALREELAAPGYSV